MDISRRKLVKALPVAAVAGVSMTVGNTSAEAIEVRPDKRYVFRINSEYVTQQDVDAIRSKLVERGFPECIVISGNVDIFELE